MPNGNIDVTLSLKYFSFGFKKKDKKNVFVKEIKEWNSVAGYFLGKLFKKNKTAVIFDKEIEIPKNKDKVNLKKIFKLLTKWEYNNNTDKMLVNIIKIIGPEPEWKKFAKIIEDNIR